MQSVGEQTIGYYDGHRRAGHGDSQNNHLYSAGVELAAIGVAANNPKDLDWAKATYDNGLIRSSRMELFHWRWPGAAGPCTITFMHWRLSFYLQSLEKRIILIFMLIPTGADDGWNFALSFSRRAIHRLVNFSVAGLQDPAPFVKATESRRRCRK
jgi:poly(beta-D-mannuronate) lyase